LSEYIGINVIMKLYLQKRLTINIVCQGKLLECLLLAEAYKSKD